MVVLDVKMPGMDGVEVLRRVKQEHPLVEVIMLTGHASVESAVDGLRFGAFDYVMKPIDIPDLLQKIEEAYGKKKAHDEKIRAAKVNEIISHPMAVFSDNPEDHGKRQKGRSRTSWRLWSLNPMNVKRVKGSLWASTSAGW